MAEGDPPVSDRPGRRPADLPAITDDQFPADPRLDLLLNAVDRVPLAIDLLAHVAEAEPNLSGLWRRWQTERPPCSGEPREATASRTLSFPLNFAHRPPHEADEARRLLSLLGVLPDGIAHEDLNEVLPQAGDRAANVLRRVGLAFDQGDRLRVLAPIREYVARKHPPSPDDLARAVAHYGALAEKYGPLAGKEGGAEAVQRLATETTNLEVMILRG